jgi:hypothetical protein
MCGDPAPFVRRYDSCCIAASSVEEAPMSYFAQVMAFLPAVAAIAVIAAAVMDRRESARLDGLRALDFTLVQSQQSDDDLESSAA